MTVALAITEDPPVDVDPSTGKGPEFGKAAPVGLLVILLMVIATFFLLRSMVRKINRVPTTFEPAAESDVIDEEPADPTATDSSAPAIGAAPSPGADPGSAGLVDKR